MSQKTSGNDNFQVMKSLLPYIWPSDRPDLRRNVVLAFFMLILAKLTTVAAPIAYKAAVDHLTPVTNGQISVGAALSIPFWFIMAYGAARIFMIVFNQIRDVFFVSVGQYAVRTLSRQTFDHMLALSLRFHLERHTGAVSRVIERGTRAVELVIRMGMLNSVPTVIEIVLISALLVYTLGWMFVLIILVTIVVYVVYTVKASEWRILIRREMNEADNEAMSRAVDSLLNYETIKYYGNESLEVGRYDESRAQYEKAAIRTHVTLGYLNAGQSVIFTTGLVVCMLIAGQGVLAGTLTLGDFVMVNALLIQLYQPLHFMGTVYRELRQALVDLENLFVILRRAPEIIDKPKAKSLVVQDAEIRFSDVYFSYDSKRPILKGVSFTVPAGKTLAIVGASGGGKSTISRLLFRFYEIDKGKIEIDGQDIALVKQHSLRSAIGMVPQDTVLFNNTIFHNINYGKVSADKEAVMQAAKMAQIHDFIISLPDGYDTIVGERGLKLSGGEKQRVAIARTILKDPPILLLDEATSALDSHTEQEIQSALEHIARDKTAIVIAHRLSTIVNADEIVVLSQGEVAERGVHQELVKKGGLYAKMWERQLKTAKAQQYLDEILEP